MRLYFEPTPFYNVEFESLLPEFKETCIYDFLIFLNEYKRIESILDKQYTQNDENLWIVLGEKKGEIKPVSHTEYNKLHSDFQRLRSYYQLLLLAAKNRYGIWLNDYIPDEFKSQPKKRKKRTA